MTYRSVVRVVAWLVSIPLAVATIAACGDDDDETVGPEEDADVEDVTEDDDGVLDEDELDEVGDDEFVGETVTVNGRIDRVIEPDNSFVIGEDVVENGLLVLTPPDTNVSGVTIEDGTDVQVEGEVVQFTVADIEVDYDPFDLDHELYTDYEEENVLVAQSVTEAPSENTGDTATTTGDTTTTTTTS